MTKNKLPGWPLSLCKESVSRKWGIDARDRLGAKLYEALLCTELTILCSNQDSSIEDSTVRRVLNDGRTQIIEEVN